MNIMLMWNTGEEYFMDIKEQCRIRMYNTYYQLAT